MIRNAMRKALLLIAAALASFPLASSAIFRAYVSSTGSDANPCTLQQPCRLLPAALAAADPGGEIWMLDSANFNTGTVLVNKSISILAVPGVVGSVVATGGGDAIQVDGAGIGVSLRNLVIVSLGPSDDGIEFLQGDRLTVAGCEISGVAGNGIHASASGVLNVRDTVVRDVNGFGIVAHTGPIQVVLDRVNLHGNTSNISAAGGVRMTIARSTLSGGTYGVLANSAGGPTVVTIDSTVVADAGNGIRADGGSSNVEVMVRDSTITGASTVAIRAVTTNAAGSAVVALDGNTLSKNHIAIDNAGGPGIEVINTRQNNTLQFNNIDVQGALSPLGGT